MNPENWVLIISLLPFLFIKICTSLDTLTPNQSLKNDGLLVSAAGTFALGFFSLGNPTHTYVGIRFNKISNQSVVWVGNRANPINGTSGVLSINEDGNLILQVNNNQTILISRTNVKTTNCSARLLDSGNLILFYNDESGKSVVAWQSFDYPTDTQLPGMKLGLDRRSGLDRVLTSWKSRTDPSPGEYNYRVDPDGLPQLVVNRGSERRWRSIPWMGSRWIGREAMANSFLFKAIFADNEDEVSEVYSVENDSIMWKFLDESGTIRMMRWMERDRRWGELMSLPKDRCDDYGCCGPFGYCDSNKGVESQCNCLPGYEPRSPREWRLGNGSGGCKRKRALSMCKNGEWFKKVENVKIPDTSQKTFGRTKLSMEECKKECFNNCTCAAYTSLESGECVTWHGDLMDMRIFNGGLDLYIRVDAEEPTQQSKKSGNLRGKNLAIVVTSIVVTVVMITYFVCWLVLRRTKKVDSEHNYQPFDEENLELPMFDMFTIAGATDKFSDKNIIGEGGFGQVYKGQLSNGKVIAVKRLSANSNQGLNEFKNEVMLIAKLQHRNLVKLLGCCIHGEERMLVYEYMNNGSLDSFIFGQENTRNLLAWGGRLDIIVGIARGILYLHQDSRLTVIHRDLKASNVLLDSEMNPKISDFGLAKTFGGHQSSAQTKNVVGTYGYIAPEYVVDGIFSMKSDIFSFGVIVLEIISGKRNRMFHHPDHDLNLLGHAWNLWIEGKGIELLDPKVESPFSASELLKYIQVGLLCVQKSPEDRPSMASVLLMLITDTVMLPQPKKPGFYTERNYVEADYLLSESTGGTNEMTMTQIVPR
ncbi:G-type lectin S-receptor-like serine/threonine-protein kinase RKS1 isoform X2 [Diospyros lotus]|uniref:G-type lectin S-receptor-like serine/threonine-protein kinase RKS1 isoform X2 n=1 Tax=Diospyros lotus TaxID=55363 RepID=UPI00225B5C5A|nr:G-type lectin S-receptor-like serine/threonine-protein kinase RKS1 isoform X2 [Diospyros lotus]